LLERIMAQASPIEFPPFHLDVANEQLWRGPEQIHLRPKTFAALRFLVEHSEQLVTKKALFQVLWPGTYVSDSVLMVCIRELRKALGDEARAPRFIETVHGRGYRFIAEVVSSQHSVVSSPSSHPNAKPQPPAPSFVGREAELRQLHQWLGKALDGERQTVFVTGEPGIGKTTIVEAFLSQLAIEDKIWIGRGQCIEHYGAGEAYMPVLEALGRLSRASEGEHLIDVLNRYAPTWLVQLPALLNTADFEQLQRKVQGTTRERMLREMAEAVEALTAERPLILCLEDLHWSDVSTLELLSILARRQEPARLLVLGTYRPVEMLGNGHPLRAVKQELQLHHQCEERRLGFLTEQNVAEYLTSRFAAEAHGRASLQRLARAIHQRTDGNPLFMVNVVDYMTAQGVLRESGEIRPALRIEVPESIQQMIEKQLDRLNPKEQWVLEVASVAGVDFSAAAVAAGAKMTTGDVETCCTGLARREQFLRTTGVSEWPDGTVATCYHFLHALYQEVLYERVPAGQRSSLHKWIGEREEAAYGERAREIAAELAVHFEQGRDYRKAVQYLQYAGQNANQRLAHQEAITHLTKGLELLKLLPNTPERARQELTLQTTLGPLLIAAKGYGAPETERAWTRAYDLGQQLGEPSQLLPVLWGLQQIYVSRPDYLRAREYGEQMLSLAQRLQDPSLLLWAYRGLQEASLFLGECLTAKTYGESGAALYDPHQRRAQTFVYGEDPAMATLPFYGSSLFLLGYPDQALRKSREALTLARELAHANSLAFAFHIIGLVHCYRREGEEAREQAEATIALTTEQGLPFWLALGTMGRGWALVEQGEGEAGIAQIHQGLAAFRASGGEQMQTYSLARLAEAYGQGGQVEEGLAALTEALDFVDRTEERFYEAELYRLKGELMLQNSRVQGTESGIKKRREARIANRQSKIPSLQPLALSTPAESEAEVCFHEAIEVSQRQQAKSLELRATMSLARLWQRQDKKDEARQMLAAIYGWFTEGFDTKDLQEAKALLQELA
jgi:DNA-binding winged helix-turn-helix (wHTH) protein/predicted ATPase